MAFDWQISPILRLVDEQADREYKWLLARLMALLREFYEKATYQPSG